MPAAFMSFSNPAKSPLTMRSRCGYVWLPIGRPSGLAETLVGQERGERRVGRGFSEELSSVHCAHRFTPCLLPSAFSLAGAGSTADGVASCHEIVIIEHPMMIEICPDWRVS